MKKKTMVDLIAMGVVIAAVVFLGCIGEKTPTGENATGSITTPVSTKAPSTTPPPKDAMEILEFEETNPKFLKNPEEYKGKYIFTLKFQENTNPNKLDLFIPVPKEWSTQKNVQIVSITPEGSHGFDQVYKNQYAYFTLDDVSNKKIVVKEIFNFQCYEVETNVDPEKVGEYNINSLLCRGYTKGEEFIDVDRLRPVAQEIVGNEKNPYKQSRLIYDWVIDNMDNSPVEGIKGSIYAYNNKRGECGDYSALFVALERSLGIPSRPIIGFWANPQYGSTHVWAEFYLPNYGWIPVDPTIGDQSDEKREFYFGNMDNRRLIMSKGFNIQLNNHTAELFQVGAYWWWGSGDHPNTDFKYEKLDKRE